LKTCRGRCRGRWAGRCAGRGSVGAQSMNTQLLISAYTISYSVDVQL